MLEDNGLNVQRFKMASTPDQALEAGKELSIYKLILDIFLHFISKNCLNFSEHDC